MATTTAPKRGRVAAVGGSAKRVRFEGGPFNGQDFLTRINEGCYTLVFKGVDGQPGRYKIHHGFKHKGIWENV